MSDTTEDIAAKRETAGHFRNAAKIVQETGDNLHALIVESIICLRATDPLSREKTIERLTRIDVIAKAVVDEAAILANGVAALHDNEANNREMGLR